MGGGFLGQVIKQVIILICSPLSRNFVKIMTLNDYSRDGAQPEGLTQSSAPPFTKKRGLGQMS